MFTNYTPDLLNEGALRYIRFVIQSTESDIKRNTAPKGAKETLAYLYHIKDLVVKDRMGTFDKTDLGQQLRSMLKEKRNA